MYQQEIEFATTKFITHHEWNNVWRMCEEQMKSKW